MKLTFKRYLSEADQNNTADPSMPEMPSDVADNNASNKKMDYDKNDPNILSKLTDDGVNIDDAVSKSDPDKQGAIRKIPGAKLIYKRKDHDGTYEEMWFIMDEDDIRKTNETKTQILAGTDIPTNGKQSKDGKQRMEFKAIGNAYILKITGVKQ